MDGSHSPIRLPSESYIIWASGELPSNIQRSVRVCSLQVKYMCTGKKTLRSSLLLGLGKETVVFKLLIDFDLPSESSRSRYSSPPIGMAFGTWECRPTRFCRSTRSPCLAVIHEVSGDVEWKPCLLRSCIFDNKKKLSCVEDSVYGKPGIQCGSVHFTFELMLTEPNASDQ